MKTSSFLARRLRGGALILLAGLTVTGFAADQWSVTSPNGQIRLTLKLADLGGQADYPDGATRLYYRIEHGPAEARAMVLQDSPLGMLWDDLDFLDDLQFVRWTEPSRVTVDYRQPHGKRHHCHNEATAATVWFRNRDGAQLAVDLRAYQDGAALRYRVKEAPGGLHRLVSEATGFALPSDARLWLAPADHPTKYSPAYERYYETEVPVGAESPTHRGWSFPVLFRSADARHWGLITEANLGPNYFGARLTSTADGGVYRVRIPDPAEGNGTGDLAPTFGTPFTSPWRVCCWATLRAQSRNPRWSTISANRAGSRIRLGFGPGGWRGAGGLINPARKTARSKSSSLISRLSLAGNTCWWTRTGRSWITATFTTSCVTRKRKGWA